MHLGLSYLALTARLEAAGISVSPPTVTRWCDGVTSPKANIIRTVAGVLECHHDYLLGAQDEPGEPAA